MDFLEDGECASFDIVLKRADSGGTQQSPQEHKHRQTRRYRTGGAKLAKRRSMAGVLVHAAISPNLSNEMNVQDSMEPAGYSDLIREYILYNCDSE